MSFPKQSEIELPLLRLLHELGGRSQPKELYPKLAELFPQLTEEDLSARLPSKPVDLPVAQPRSVEPAKARRKG